MGLKGINKITVTHLIDILNVIEEFENSNSPSSCDCEKIMALKEELTESYDKYELMLRDIEVQVQVYKEIYNKIRFRFVPEKLKVLRRIIPVESTEYDRLRRTIHKSYLA